MYTFCRNVCSAPGMIAFIIPIFPDNTSSSLALGIGSESVSIQRTEEMFSERKIRLPFSLDIFPGTA